MQLHIGDWQIRSWRPEDETSVVRYANNFNVWINLRNTFPHPYTAQDFRDWMELVAREQPETKFAIGSETEAIGGIGLRLQEDVHRRSAEIGYWLGEPHWGQGIGTRAARAMTEYAFEKFDLVRVYGSVFEWNPASARVLEKAGFTYEGRLRKNVTKNGQIIDQLLYAIVREPQQ
ncbi:MAG: GNAT family N-acetyltransferase [Dehalococcoidia bacterium]